MSDVIASWFVSLSFRSPSTAFTRLLSAAKDAVASAQTPE
jgi:hypothetical protein